jgi:hypothetical protein
LSSLPSPVRPTSAESVASRGFGRRALRVLIIAYTNYIYDGRVKRHAEALADRGDHVDVISHDSLNAGDNKGVQLIGIEMPRYRGQSR